MKYFKKANLLTPLIIAAAFGFAFRAASIVMPAGAVESPQAAKEEPPPISKEDLAKVVKDAAKPEGAVKAEAEAKPVVVTPPAGAGTPPPPEPSASFSSSEIEVLQSLAKRRDEIDQREKSVAERAALLKAAEQEVDRKITELNKLKGDMEKLLGQQEKAEEGRIASLVKIYENMKPADAARIFDQLDMNILLDVIGRMNERKVSPVLAGMNPEKAKDITVRLAEQRRLPEAGKAAVAGKIPAPTK